MRTLYSLRQEILLSEMEKHLKGLIEVKKAEAGMHLIGWLQAGADDEKISNDLREHGVRAAPVSAYCINRSKQGGLLLGYTAFNERQIGEGVKRMAKRLTAKPA
jgi:GntR family transcriptional regulator / MocR family aminotransferase